MKSLIIDRPEKRSLQQRYGDNSLKIFLALVWFYVWIPAITSGAWYLAYTFYNQHLILLEGYKEYETRTSLWYIGIIVAILVLFMAWSRGNKYLAKRRCAKHQRSALSLSESGLYYGIQEKDLTCYRNMKNMTVSFDTQDAIAAVDEKRIVSL